MTASMAARELIDAGEVGKLVGRYYEKPGVWRGAVAAARDEGGQIAVLIARRNDHQPYIVAHNFDPTHAEWSNGSYHSTLRSALDDYDGRGRVKGGDEGITVVIPVDQAKKMLADLALCAEAYGDDRAADGVYWDADDTMKGIGWEVQELLSEAAPELASEAERAAAGHYRKLCAGQAADR